MSLPGDTRVAECESGIFKSDFQKSCQAVELSIDAEGGFSAWGGEKGAMTGGSSGVEFC